MVFLIRDQTAGLKFIEFFIFMQKLPSTCTSEGVQWSDDSLQLAMEDKDRKCELFQSFTRAVHTLQNSEKTTKEE
jgi:hypothetical protein